jgi:hypothetical protein
MADQAVGKSSPSDTQIVRKVVNMLVADRHQLSLCAAAMRGTAQVLRWQSAEQRDRAAEARATAQALRRDRGRAVAKKEDVRPPPARR